MSLPVSLEHNQSSCGYFSVLGGLSLFRNIDVAISKQMPQTMNAVKILAKVLIIDTWDASSALKFLVNDQLVEQIHPSNAEAPQLFDLYALSTQPM